MTSRPRPTLRSRRAAPRRRRAARGFTLAEMLVALFAFGLISSAATAVLTFSIRAKDALSEADARLRDLQMARTLMRADFAQLALRPVRDPFGVSQGVSFAGGRDAPGGALVAMVRRGWENPNGEEGRASLQYIEYRLEDGALIRAARPRLDATEDTPVTERRLIEGVEAVSVEFLQGQQWSDRWVALGSGGPGTPAAIAFEFRLAEYGEIRQIFLAPGDQ